MASILEIILVGWIEPFLWLMSMSELYVQKSRKQCICSFYVYYGFIIVKQIISNTIGNPTIQVVIMVATELFVIFATVLLFEGRLYKKLISVITFYCILVAAELIVVKCYSALAPNDFNIIEQDEIANYICGVIIIVVKVMACYCFFKSVKIKQYFSCNKERVFLAVMVIAMVLFIMSRSFIHRKESNMSFAMDALGILLLWNVFSFLITLKKKDNDIVNLQQDIRRSMERKELAQDIERFKHNYAVNMLVLKNLFCYQQYDTFETYMNAVFTDVEKAKLLYNHSNIAIRILMSGLLQTAKDMGIEFTVKILVREFGMEDGDICSILQNLVKNGLEAAAKVPHDIARVSLQVLPTDMGYEIRCNNTCMGTVDFTKTSKQDKKAHGFGVGIVDKIVNKYHGIVTRQCLETERAGIGYVTISVYICL